MDNFSSVINDMNMVFENADNQGRTMLFEHEVYELLSLAGLTIPTYDFITDINQVTEELLAKYNGEIMIKIVSVDIAHKQKVGGVQKIIPHDMYFVQYVLEKMEQRVLELSGTDTNISGFLIVEAVTFSQGIGYELLYGINNDRAFGPTMTISKGGSDAEFFAKYYDPANLFLPSFSYEKAFELVNQLKIKHKLESMGHSDYLKEMAVAASSISLLAYTFSPINEDKSDWYIETMDINPFVISKDGRYLVLDGYATFKKADNRPIPKPNIDHLGKFFTPKSIGVLGISSKKNNYNMASDIVELLMDLGWDENLYCINPKGGSTVLKGREFTLHKSPQELDCDLYVYAAPAKNIPIFLTSIADMKGKGVILIPGLPSDITYDDFKNNLDPILKDMDIRIIGPNCMGVFSSGGDKHVNTLFIEKERLHVQVTDYSNTALLTQSGGMAITLIDKFKNSPILHSVVSFGNKYDVKITDLVPWFMEDDDIDVIAIYVEGFDPLEGRLLFQQAQTATKPIVMYKGGKTDAGAKAASSHTAAMSGDYAVVEAMCKQANIVLCNTMESFYNAQKAFSLLAKRKVQGRNVAVACNAGFEATLAADEAGDLQISKLTEKTYDRLGELAQHGLMGVSNGILDVTPMTDDVLFGEIVNTLIDDETVDHIVVGIVPHVEILKATKDTCHDEDSIANILVRLNKTTDKPIVVSVNAGQMYQDFVKIMEDAGIPVYDNIRDAMKSLDRFVNYHLS